MCQFSRITAYGGRASPYLLAHFPPCPSPPLRPPTHPSGSEGSTLSVKVANLFLAASLRKKGQNCSVALRNFLKSSTQPFLCRSLSKRFIPVSVQRPAGQNRKIVANPHATIFLQTNKRHKTKTAQKPLHPTHRKPLRLLAF